MTIPSPPTVMRTQVSEIWESTNKGPREHMVVREPKERPGWCFIGKRFPAMDCEPLPDSQTPRGGKVPLMCAAIKRPSVPAPSPGVSLGQATQTDLPTTGWKPPLLAQLFK